ncbi:unnamed protein product [Fasciola hepatica]|uniref:Uncharacterized protein n=1 Tax=Fasciola hepatica TaxID=6192 RepID=A0ABC9HG01_FASHE
MTHDLLPRENRTATKTFPRDEWVEIHSKKRKNSALFSRHFPNILSHADFEEHTLVFHDQSQTYLVPGVAG